MAITNYIERIVDDELDQHLRASGAVVIEGPKAVGKTLTARQRSRSEVLLDVDHQAQEAIDIDPSLVLNGDTPRLIDEWQIKPRLWNHIRREIDERGVPGQFILTGSSVPSDDLTRHTGAGRLSRLRMRPLSLFEMGASSGSSSLKDLLSGRVPPAEHDKLSIEDIARLISIGGWPGFLNWSDRARLDAVRAYLQEIERTDIRRVDGVQRDPQRVNRFLRSFARNVSTTTSLTTLAADTGGPDGPIDDDTVRDYVSALERLMIVEDLPAWSPRLQSRARIRTSEKRHFVDASLAVAALSASPEMLLSDVLYMGNLFESLVLRDMRIYAQRAGARVYHYRDSYDNEADIIVQSSDGAWAAFEVKLGFGQIDAAVASLHKFRKAVDESGLQCLGVIVGTGYAYKRDDGIAVIPIGSLGP